MLISIEGCIGIGKTTVAKGLAGLRNSPLLLEEFELNPFLRPFSSNPVKYALETEFTFLMVHFHQLKRDAHLRVQGETIADFHLGKDLIYADLNLPDPDARRLFRELYQLCSEDAPQPELLVFLSAQTDLILERIRRRHRHFELQLAPGYYDAVNTAYQRYFEGYQGPKLLIPMDEWDFVATPTLYGRLAALVDDALRVP